MSIDGLVVDVDMYILHVYMCLSVSSTSTYFNDVMYVYVTLPVMWSNTILQAYTTCVYPSICLFLCLVLCARVPLSIYLFDIMCLCMNVNLRACQYSFVRLLLSHIRTYMFTSEHARFDTCINTYVYTLELFIYEYNI